MHFSLFYNLIIVCVFLWTCEALFQTVVTFWKPNGFSNLLWLNVIVVLHVSSKWAYTDFILCVQLVQEHQPAILPAMLQKSCLTPKNMEGTFAMKFLNSLGLVAQWGHTFKRKLTMRIFLCPLQAYLLPVRCLPQEGKGVSVIWCTSLPYCWRAPLAVWGVSLLNLLICSTHTGQRDALRQQRPHLVAPSDVH